MDPGLAWTIGSASLAFIALGCSFFSWAYFVYVGPNPSVLFASLIALAGLFFAIAGVAALRYTVIGVTGGGSSVGTSFTRRLAILREVIRSVVLAVLIASLTLLLLSLVWNRPPRLLYPDETRSMVYQLKKIAQPGRVQIIRDDDERCRALADQYSQIFLDAGWQQVSNPRAAKAGDYLARFNRGMKIYRFTLDRPSLQFMAILDIFHVNYGRFDDDPLLYNADYFILTISDSWL